MRRAWRCVGWVIVALVIVGAIGFAYAYYGFYNVSAVYSDWKPVAWFLDTTMGASVQRHARGVTVPSLDSPDMYRLGFQHYRGMCQECHAAPGAEAEELAKGLRPEPPELVEAAGDWKPNELYWLVKNGVRMTGMPAFGPTHSEDELWAMVAFVQRLPKLSEADYKKLDRGTPQLSE